MMATKFYTKKAQYRLPAWHLGATYMDGVYIDGGLFENNTPVHDGTIRMSVTPQSAPICDNWVNIGFPSFESGKVVRIGHKFWWPPFSDKAQYHDLYYNGSPYGIGLNTIAIELTLSPLPIPSDIVYDVIIVFALEVG
jgi:hypothetical protein